MSCKSPSLMGELIGCDLLVAYNQTSLAFSLDFGDGTNLGYSLTGKSNYLNFYKRLFLSMIIILIHYF